MSGMNNDPVFDRLARFSPNSGKLNRDDLLFQAGRASVRVRPWWKLLTGVLAVTQVVSLALVFISPARRAEPVRELPRIPLILPDNSPGEPASPPESSVARIDPDRWPTPETIADPPPSRPTWTVMTARTFSVD